MDGDSVYREEQKTNINRMLGLLPMFILIILIILRISWVLFRSTVGQKTRSTQQRRVYVGSRTRQLSVQEPTIYVSPANLPPPPKYEAMAPPSYEEVMGIQYPNLTGQPITQPITHALTQSTSAPTNTTANTAATDISVANEANSTTNTETIPQASTTPVTLPQASTTPVTLPQASASPTTLTITNETRRSSVTVSS